MSRPICAFCMTAEAVASIDRSNCPICSGCLEVYESGQSNPDGSISRYDDNDDLPALESEGSHE